jgi:hypothetical protein
VSRRRRAPLTVAILLVALLAMVATACQVESTATIRVEPDGAGTVAVAVVLDAEATRRLGDPSTALALDDLAQAGWSVDEPVAVDGGLELRAERSFASPDDLPAVLAEVGGVDGVFRDVELRVVDGFSRTDYEFAAGVELTGSPEQFSDADLRSVLGDLALGRTPDQLAFEGAGDPDAMRLVVRVELPGDELETSGRVRDGAAEWSFPVTGGEPTSATLSAATSTGSSRTWILAGAGAAMLVAAAVLAAVAVRRRSRS